MAINEGPTNDETQIKSNDAKRLISKTKKGWSRFYITIEPIKFCVGFTMAFTSGVTIDLLQRNICATKYGLTLAACSSQNISKSIKSSVEGEVAQISMIINIIQGIMPLILVMFIGPWSDHNGRKPFILWALGGFVIYYLFWSILSFFPFIPVIYFFIPSIPLSCTGAMITIYVCTWSYTCDNFQPEEWTKRFSISVAAMLSGKLLGNALAEQIVVWGGENGFQIVFLISVIISFLAFIYTLFVLEETIVRNKDDRSRLFDLNHVKSIIDTVLINPEKGRWLISFILLVLFTEIPSCSGDESILYLVGKSEYDWTLGNYNLYSALASLISGQVPVLGLWLMMDIFGMSNSSVLVTASFVQLFLHVAKALSVNQTMFWIIGLTINGFQMIGPTIDTELAETVSESNVGKAFTFTSLVDALAPLLATPLYTQVYTLLLPNRTLYVFFLSFGLTIITFIASVLLYFKRKSLSNKDKAITSSNNQAYDSNPSEASV